VILPPLVFPAVTLNASYNRVTVNTLVGLPYYKNYHYFKATFCSQGTAPVSKMNVSYL